MEKECNLSSWDKDEIQDFVLLLFQNVSLPVEKKISRTDGIIGGRYDSENDTSLQPIRKHVIEIDLTKFRTLSSSFPPFLTP